MNCLILNSNSIINLKLDTYVKSIILSTDLTFLANLVILSFFLAIFYAIITRYEFVDPKFEFTINSRLNTYFKSITRSNWQIWWFLTVFVYFIYQSYQIWFIRSQFRCLWLNQYYKCISNQSLQQLDFVFGKGGCF